MYAIYTYIGSFKDKPKRGYGDDIVRESALEVSNVSSGFKLSIRRESLMYLPSQTMHF